MPMLYIYKKGDECLEKRCHKVTRFDKRLKLLVRDMKETLESANGVGLAAAGRNYTQGICRQHGREIKGLSAKL